MNIRFSYERAFEEYESINISFAMALLLPFNVSPFIMINETIQFFREEAKYIYDNGEYGKKLARELFTNENEYINVQKESTLTDINYIGGPRDTLSKIILDYSKETEAHSNLPILFRCSIVRNIGLINKCKCTPIIVNKNGTDRKLVTNLSIHSIILPSLEVNELLMSQIHKKVAYADNILGELRAKYPDYFEKFYIY